MVLSSVETGRQGRLAQGIGASCTDAASGRPDALGAGEVSVEQGEASPSLVRQEHNSVICRHGIWLLRECREHEYPRWVQVPCKRRTCETCGPLGRWRIAERIAYGVRVLGVDRCAWLVLTFEKDVTKVAAVRRLAAFVRFLRKIVPGLQYAATYELQKSGRLHINLVVGPWDFTDRWKLQDAWGARLWIAWVKEEKDVGNEVAKNYSPESLGNYVSKLDQAVPRDRRVSFSRGWPKPPEDDTPESPFIYTRVPDEAVAEIQLRIQLGYLVEETPGVWRDAWPFAVPDCACHSPPSVYRDTG